MTKHACLKSNRTKSTNIDIGIALVRTIYKYRHSFDLSIVISSSTLHESYNSWWNLGSNSNLWGSPSVKLWHMIMKHVQCARLKIRSTPKRCRQQ